MDNTIDEIWVPIPGWETLYSVSNLGRVKSENRVITRHANRGGSIRSRVSSDVSYQGRILKYVYAYRDPEVHLYNAGVRNTYKVKKLVKLCFDYSKISEEVKRKIDYKYTKSL